jgi:UDP-N-acetylmuramate dehydrogenase
VTASATIEIQENIPLGPLTTLKVGGPARFYTLAESEQQILGAFEYAKKHSLDAFVLGGGSNILVSDRGFDGIVVHVALKGIEKTESTGRITVQAGENWDPFVAYCVDHDLAGLECLSGIPGFVGGTPVQNVGAYGQEVSESIVAVRCFDRDAGRIVDLSNSDCGFRYRTSIFNSTDRDRYVVLSVTYDLGPGGEPKIAYKDLKEHFGTRRPTLRETRDAVLEIRRAKSMVIDEGDPNSRSAGSFFKNPIIDRSLYESIVAANGAAVPQFPAGENTVKVPAAWLIEQSGFHKGYESGRAGISTKHSLAIVNRGGATSADIISLEEKIQHAVVQKFDILLQPEPVFVGFD